MNYKGLILKTNILLSLSAGASQAGFVHGTGRERAEVFEIKDL